MASINLFYLIVHASIMIKLIILLLLIASIQSWCLMLNRSWLIRQAFKSSQSFEHLATSAASLKRLYQRSSEVEQHGLWSMLGSCIQVAQDRLVHHPSYQQLNDELKKRLDLARHQQLFRLEESVDWLATLASVTPFVGLLGTVWGMVHAFVDLGKSVQPSLVLLAPGIAEALLATLCGLLVAIPAAVGYNRINRQLERLDMDWQQQGVELAARLADEFLSSPRAEVMSEIR